MEKIVLFFALFLSLSSSSLTFSSRAVMSLGRLKAERREACNNIKKLLVFSLITTIVTAFSEKQSLHRFQLAMLFCCAALIMDNVNKPVSRSKEWTKYLKSVLFVFSGLIALNGAHYLVQGK